MKHLKKHPKQQRMEDMVTPDGKFVHKSIKKRNKLIARALDGKKPLDLSGGVHKSKGRPLTISDVDMAHKEYQKHGAISGFPTWYPKEDKTFPLQKNKPSPVFVRMGDKIIPYRGKSGNKKGTNIVSNKSPDIDIFVDTNLDSHTYINNKKVTFPNLNDFGFAVAVRKLLDEGTKPEKDMTFPITKMGKKMNKIIAKALDKKHVDTPAKGSRLTLDKLEAQFKKAFDPEMDTCFICNPPRPNREHKTMGGKPVHERDDVLSNTMYMVNEDMFCLPDKKEKVTWTGREWLRSISDPHHERHVAVVILLVASIIYCVAIIL